MRDTYAYSLSLSVVYFLLRRETMLFRWIRSAPWISSFCCCHPMTRPSLIIVHLAVVSRRTKRHGAMYACWHNTEIEQRTRRQARRDWRNSRETENTRCLKGSSWARSRTSKRSHSCSERSGGGRVRRKQYHILMGVAINHFLLLPFPLTSIGEEHERTMILSRLMHVCLHPSVFLRCHSCSIIIFLLLFTDTRFSRRCLTFSVRVSCTYGTKESSIETRTLLQNYKGYGWILFIHNWGESCEDDNDEHPGEFVYVRLSIDFFFFLIILLRLSHSWETHAFSPAKTSTALKWNVKSN